MAEEIIVKINGKEHKVNIEETSDGKLKVHYDNKTYEVETKSAAEQLINEELEKKSGSKEKEIRAPLPGIVFSIKAKAGDKVREGDKLISLMAMKMENEIESPIDGRIKEIKVKKNTSVNKGDLLIIFE